MFISCMTHWIPVYCAIIIERLINFVSKLMYYRYLTKLMQFEAGFKPIKITVNVPFLQRSPNLTYKFHHSCMLTALRSIIIIINT